MDLQKRYIKALEFDKVLDKLSGFAQFRQSKRLCLDANIYDVPEAISNQLNYTKEAKTILDLALDIPFEFIQDVNAIIESTLSTYLNETEIINVAKTIRTSRLVKNFFKENSTIASTLNLIAMKLFADKELEDSIFDTFDAPGNIVQDATPELKSYYLSLRDTEKNIKDKVSALMNSPEFSKHLQEQIYTTRDERIVFQVRASSKSKVEGIVHDVSSSNQSFYIEPKSIVPLNNKIKELKIKIQKEIINILTGLTKLIRKNIEEIKLSEGILAEFDFHFAKARYAISSKSVEPELIGYKEIVLKSMRHPLLIDYVDDVVENDFEIGKDYKAIIITGSNTGGKTVVIKTLGLFLLMLKSGMFLPCAEAKIYPFENIFADIGDEQNIAQSLSTFSSHMTNIINILNNSTDRDLVLIDELCAGTDPVEGSILAQVILEEFANKNVMGCITTHYGELKALEFSNAFFKNASVEFDSNTLMPTYKLVIGIPGLSNAISISSNLGLSSTLVSKAKDILISQKDPSIVVVEKLQQTQYELAQNLKEAQELKQKAEELKQEYEKKMSELKKDKKKTVKQVKDKLDSGLDNAKDEIKDILTELRKEKSEKIARRSYSRLAKLEKEFRADLSKFEESEKYDELNWDSIVIGEKIMLKELNQEVILLSMPDKSDNIFIQMGLIKTKINKNKVAKLDRKFTKTLKLRFEPKESFAIQRHEMSNTLDLRGYRVEEALDSLEVFLDKASLVNLNPVYIIHGHGTGALKSGVREFLSNSPYVAKYRFGEPAEGGDGVSVIDIN